MKKTKIIGIDSSLKEIILFEGELPEGIPITFLKNNLSIKDRFSCSTADLIIVKILQGQDNAFIQTVCYYLDFNVLNAHIFKLEYSQMMKDKDVREFVQLVNSYLNSSLHQVKNYNFVFYRVVGKTMVMCDDYDTHLMSIMVTDGKVTQQFSKSEIFPIPHLN